MKSIFTIEDLEEATYGGLIARELRKDAPVVQATTDMYNAVFGAKLWSGIANQANLFGLLPKKPWEKSGYRLVTTAAHTATQSVAEAGAIPATTKPTATEVTIPVHNQCISFEMSSAMLGLEGKDDVLSWSEQREYMAKEYAKTIDLALNYKLDTATTLTTSFESVDRICASYDEANSVAAVGADEADIWGNDRDGGATAFDAYVSHSSGTTRVLTRALMNDLIENCAPYWNGGIGNKTWYTGYDTLMDISEMFDSQQRFQGITEQRVTFGVNGIQTVTGADVGMLAAAYQGMPIIPDSNCTVDTKSRLYLLDLDYLWVGVLSPVQYIESQNYQLLDKFSREGVYFMEGNSVCTGFKQQGKIRDLK